MKRWPTVHNFLQWKAFRASFLQTAYFNDERFNPLTHDKYCGIDLRAYDWEEKDILIGPCRNWRTSWKLGNTLGLTNLEGGGIGK